jgi:hypothetical protein
VAPILWFGLGLALVGLVLHGVVAWMMIGFWEENKQAQPPLPPIAGERTVLPEDLAKIPQPRLQLSDVEDLKILRQKDYAILTSYEMIDAKNHVVRIPIARAMELIAGKEKP